MVNKKERTLCMDDPNQTFTECAMRILPKLLQNSSIDCLNSFWKGLQKYSNMTSCQMNETQARQVFFLLFIDLFFVSLVYVEKVMRPSAASI